MSNQNTNKCARMEIKFSNGEMLEQCCLNLTTCNAECLQYIPLTEYIAKVEQFNGFNEPLSSEYITYPERIDEILTETKVHNARVNCNADYIKVRVHALQK